MEYREVVEGQGETLFMSLFGMQKAWDLAKKVM